MLMPRTAVTMTVTAMKMTDLMTGPARLVRFMPRSPQPHRDAAEQGCGEQAAPGWDGPAGRPKREGGQFSDQFAFQGRAGQRGGRQRGGGVRGRAARGVPGVRLGEAGRRAGRGGAVVEGDAGERDRVAVRAQVVTVDGGVL